MEAALSQTPTLGIIEKIKSISSLCKISNIEKMLSDCLEGMPDTSPVDYIGELNKNDVMH